VHPAVTTTTPTTISPRLSTSKSLNNTKEDDDKDKDSKINNKYSVPKCFFVSRAKS